ncbi:MAG: transcriptional regulator GcvA [Rhodospirillaceae bacterium]|jgi:LysR family transcriptional regulator, glycine cleavage system transcriptional activator|nr:transcriptional regulator GcvA [Rhodospirillaceae bacterium]
MLPPLNPLHTFSVAAGLSSFTAAAESLGVSQAAVSRQVAVLENALGVHLFERRGRRVRLTDAGRRYHRDIAAAFDTIEQATRQLASGNDPRTIRVQVYPTFAARWLLPRLAQFSLEHPDCNVRLQTGVGRVDFSRDDIDIAIQFGDGHWPDMEMALVFPDVIEPVCSPRLIEQLGGLRTSDDLARAPILQTRYRNRDWSDWLRSVGSAKPSGERDQYFESSLLAYQAAIEGIGVAMGQVNLLDDAFSAGSLVRPFERPLVRNLGYYALWPERRRVGHGTRRFVDWLLHEGAATQ